MAFGSSGDEERLFITLEARVADFEKKMAAAERRGTKTYTSLQKGSASATRAMEGDMVRASDRINQALASTSGQIGKFQALAGGLRGGPIAAGVTAVGLALLAAGKAANAAATEIAQVGDEAKRAGVSAQAFQEWKYVAEQNRIGIDQMTDGLKELSLRADEFVTTGGGAAAEAFGRLGYTAEQLRDKLKNPSALLLEIIGRLGKLDQAAQIRIADEVFGGSAGERFVELIDQGEDGLRRTIERAHSLGVVMDDELIAKASELNRAFSSVTATVGTALKGAIVSAAHALGEFLGAFGKFEDRAAASRQAMLSDVEAKRTALQTEIQQLEDTGGLTDNAKKLGFGTASAVEQKRMADLRAELADVNKEYDRMLETHKRLSAAEAPPVPPPPPHTDATEDSRNTWNRGVNLTWEDRQKLNKPAAGGGGSASGGGGGGGSATNDDLEREMESVIRSTAALKAKTAAQREINPVLLDYGLASERAAIAADLLTAAQQAGIAITPELRSRIDELATGYGEAAAEANRLDNAQVGAVKRAQELAGLKQDVVGGIVKGLREGRDAADLFAAALDKIADRALDLALEQIFSPKPSAGGGGFISSIISSIFGAPGFAAGGYTGRGGKHDPAGIVHAGEFVFSKAAVERLGVERLDAMHRAARRGYAEGGAVVPQPPAATYQQEPGGPQVVAKIVNVLDPADILEASLRTTAGERVMMNFVFRNRRSLAMQLR